MCDERSVSVQSLFCRVLFPGFVKNSIHHSFVVFIGGFLEAFCKSLRGATI